MDALIVSGFVFNIMKKSIPLKEIVGYLTEDDSVLFYDNKTLEEIPGEIFKEYPLNPQYLVSNLGRVKSKEQSVNHPTGRKAIKKERILTQTDNGSGYLSVGMYFNGKSKNLRVSRVVAITWIDNPEDKPQVNHKRGKKYDNREWMLEWNTAGENVRHSWNTGLCRKSDYHLEVVSKMKIINNYLAYTPTVITPIGKGKITIDDAAYRIIYENGKMENLVKSVRFWKKEFKLVLRDLSDLTKEITHNGETFVPIEVLGNKYTSHKCYLYPNTLNVDTKDIDSLNLLDKIWVIQKLHEWHFDIYDWIKYGLAVSINDL